MSIAEKVEEVMLSADGGLDYQLAFVVSIALLVIVWLISPTRREALRDPESARWRILVLILFAVFLGLSPWMVLLS